MKIFRCLAWLCAFCMLFSGCSSTQQLSPETTASTTAVTATPTIPSTMAEDDSMHLQNPGKLRIPYTVNRSSVEYISSVSQLPNYDAFQEYDEEFFQARALLLVTETVGSGSADISIASVTVFDSAATVVLSHKMPGEAATADMATWLLWVEVDAGLDLHWTVANPTFENALVPHTK